MKCIKRVLVASGASHKLCQCTCPVSSDMHERILTLTWHTIRRLMIDTNNILPKTLPELTFALWQGPFVTPRHPKRFVEDVWVCED